MIDGSLIPLWFRGDTGGPWNPDVWCVELGVTVQADVDANVHRTHEHEAVFTLTGSFESNVARTVEWECIER